MVEKIWAKMVEKIRAKFLSLKTSPRLVLKSPWFWPLHSIGQLLFILFCDWKLELTTTNTTNTNITLAIGSKGSALSGEPIKAKKIHKRSFAFFYKLSNTIKLSKNWQPLVNLFSFFPF